MTSRIQCTYAALPIYTHYQQEMELRSLIDSQPTAVEAVRLKTFLKPHPQSHTHHDPLTQVQVINQSHFSKSFFGKMVMA